MLTPATSRRPAINCELQLFAAGNEIPPTIPFTLVTNVAVLAGVPTRGLCSRPPLAGLAGGRGRALCWPAALANTHLGGANLYSDTYATLPLACPVGDEFRTPPSGPGPYDFEQVKEKKKDNIHPLLYNFFRSSSEALTTTHTYRVADLAIPILQTPGRTRANAHATTEVLGTREEFPDPAAPRTSTKTLGRRYPGLHLHWFYI